jgi:hypothetical protein
MVEKDDTDWKAIALALAQRVNFAMGNLKCEGSGLLGNLEKPSSEWRHWTRYMAEAMEMIPGTKVDFEMLDTMALPRAKRKKAQAAIKASRAALLPDNAELSAPTGATRTPC